MGITRLQNLMFLNRSDSDVEQDYIYLPKS